MRRVVGPCLLLLVTVLACSSDPTTDPVSPDIEGDGGPPGALPGDAAADGSQPADQDGAAPLPASCLLCAQYGAPQDQGPLPNQLVETSGIVASRLHPGVLYAHNDSGDVPRVIAVDSHGALLATLN